MKIAVIHGPNLNLLGTREPEIYGTETLDEVNATIAAAAVKRGAEVEFLQSNHEGDIIDRIQEANDSERGFDGLIINPGAFTHYSYAIRDAIQAVGVPTVEVHLSNIHEREPFRRHSVIADVCREQIAGHGVQSYLLAIKQLMSV